MIHPRHFIQSLEALERRLVGVINHNAARQREYEDKLSKLRSDMKAACSDMEMRVELIRFARWSPDGDEKSMDLKGVHWRIGQLELEQKHVMASLDKFGDEISQIVKHIKGYDNRDNEIIAKVLKKLDYLEARVVDLVEEIEDY